MENYQEIFQNVLNYVKSKTTQTGFIHTFSNVSVHSIDHLAKIVYLMEPNQLKVNILTSRYTKLLEEGFQAELKDTYKVIVKTPTELKNQEAAFIEDTSITQKKIEKVNRDFRNQRIFQPSYTFDNFVVGECNEIAYAVSKAVAESPSLSYNPLFLHGGSGMGKTHLMHAIGIYLLEHNSDINVLYVTSEMFTNELIRSLGENRMNEFKRKFRQVDVLMIDDIEFLEGKETTQIEFFNTFNELYSANKQIIISSDRSPDKLTRLDERLRTRFMWKMVAELLPADYETRVAILRKKSMSYNITMDDDLEDVIRLIAEHIDDNIRVMEGALNNVIEVGLLMHEKINRALAKRILNDRIVSGSNSPTPVQIKTIVSKHFNIKVSDMESSKRTAQIAFPRQIAMYLCRNLNPDYSYEQIGHFFGGKNYSTVIHACRKIEEQLSSDDNLKSTLEQLERDIKNVHK